MSKIQSSLEKAIEKTQQSAKGKGKGKQAANRTLRETITDSAVASGIFRVFNLARPNRETMERSRIVAAIDDQSAITAYKVLRTRVLQRIRSNNWRSVLVTSAGPGEGKTLTASNLAVTISRDVNQSVVLVDLDLMKPSVAKYFGIDIRMGIGDFLNGKAEIKDIVYTPAGLDRIAIIPNREPVEHSSEFLASPRMRELCEWLKNQPDNTIVLFDMPPVLVSDDVLAFYPQVDALLLVIAQGLTERSALKRTVELIGEREIVGVVLNRAQDSSQQDTYGYGYG